MLNLLTDNRALSSGSFWHLFCLSSLYFAQGLPVGFLFLALNTYFASKGASISELAIFNSFLLIPWTIKIFLAPFVDGFTIQKFGRRRFWILSSQLGMVCALSPLTVVGSELSIYAIGIIGMFVNFCIAFQDLSTDALAADSLEEITLSKANGLMWGSQIAGKGIGMLLGTTLYFSFGIPFGIGILITLIMLIFLVPLLSRELDFKVGHEPVLNQKSILAPKVLFKEVARVFTDTRAWWAILFLIFINLGSGVYEVIYNKFFLEELNWTGEMIGSLRPWGLLSGGLMGLTAGFLGTYYQRHLLLFLFIFVQILIYFFLGMFTDGISNFFAYVIIFGIDMAGAAISVCMFAILMTLCFSQTSATNFGIFMGLANISTLMGNNLAPSLMEIFNYSGSFVFCSLSLIPAALLAFKLVRRNSVETT